MDLSVKKREKRKNSSWGQSRWHEVKFHLLLLLLRLSFFFLLSLPSKSALLAVCCVNLGHVWSFFCLMYGWLETRYVENVEKKFLGEKRQRDLVFKRPREIKSAVNAALVRRYARPHGLWDQKIRLRAAMGINFPWKPKNPVEGKNTSFSGRRRKLRWRWGHEEKDGRS